MNHLSRALIIFGVLLVILGFTLKFFGKIPFIGRLPGDIIVKKENFTFYFPVVTCLLLSLLLTLIFNLFKGR